MGASTSIVVALFFLGFLVVGAAVHSSGDYSNNLIKNAQYDQDTMKKAKIKTDVTITNVSLSSKSGNVYLNITLQNTGETTLNASLLEIFVNGSYYSSYNLTPSRNYTWVPQNKLNISLYPMNYTNTTGRRVKVVTENGISDYALSP
ncbi:MAG: hypothetical protein O8C66_13610 [Candidatus Methanoperedens sp.]|nr:hypothetical protein [Candidatus Methanoperedens sp.]MCZ7371535.1 hypothetical protein [Candidatus Methanoperedens sp.]